MSAKAATGAYRRPPRLWRGRIAGALVFLASLAMWLLIAPGWICLLATLGGSSVTYALLLVGLPVTLAAWGQLLGRLDRLYGRLAPRTAEDPGAAVPSVLASSLVISLLLALIIAAAWIALGGLGTSGHSFGPLPD